MIRIHPRYVRLSAKNISTSVIGVVYSYEYLGERGILVVNCKGEEVVLELEHTIYYQVGEEVSICFSDQYINIFDPETTKRVPLGEELT